MSVQDQKFEAPNFLRVDVVLNRAELFRNECKRLILETEKACRRMQSDDSKRLDQRVRDIQFLKKELELKLEEIVPEIDVLVDLQSRVRKALELNQEALRVTVLCLDERRRRAPSERMPDEVNTELLKEWETYEEVASLLQSVQEQISEQIRLNRSAKYHLERDLREKFEAQNIDNSCALMTVHSIHNLQMSKHNTAGLGSLGSHSKAVGEHFRSDHGQGGATEEQLFVPAGPGGVCARADSHGHAEAVQGYHRGASAPHSADQVYQEPTGREAAQDLVRDQQPAEDQRGSPSSHRRERTFPDSGPVPAGPAPTEAWQRAVPRPSTGPAPR
uniref:Tektin n=1 Tax=Fundulus heteroclitus TaxID=8078 RepID=A0A3Q2Q0B6_FUNHE